ncbi:MAG: hypothetical protein PHD55_03085 [Methanoregula sp.]|nr:hypothetical protein [Methanoregula sp.]
MDKVLWLIVAALALIVIMGCTGLWTPGPGGSHTGSDLLVHGTTPENTLTIPPDSTASPAADRQNTSINAVEENLETMAIQGIAPPCRDIQKNCDVVGPIPAGTYTRTELIGANMVPVETARQLARIACTGGNKTGISGSQNIYLNASFNEPVTVYDISGTRLYYRFSAGNETGNCTIFVKANKLLGSPLFLVRSDPDCMDDIGLQTATADKTVLADHPGYRIESSLPIFYRDDHEGIQYLLVNPETNARVTSVLDLCTFADVTKNARSLFSPVSDTEYASLFGEYEHRLSEWETENLTILNGVSS